ncbi:hypothetical protein LXL04_026903 [Taraxacum kok-saghyz]
MKRICNVMKAMDKATRPLTPTATSILEANTSHASKYKARWTGGDKYQVTGVWQDQHVVDVRNNNCSCRKWELIGIPCKHAIATLNEMTKNSEDVTNIYRWVDLRKKRKKTEDERMSRSQRGSSSQTTNQDEGIRVGKDGAKKLTRKYGKVTCSKCKNTGESAFTPLKKMVIWNRRSRFSSGLNIQEEYGNFENLCSFKIHHSGLFMKNRGVTYEYGAVDYYDFVDMDVFSIHELADMVRELDNQHSEPISFKFHIPGTQLDVGLLPLLTDGDVHVMSGFVKENKVLEIYVEHRQSTVNQILQDDIESEFGYTDSDDDETEDGIVGANDLLYDKNNIVDEPDVDMSNFISVLDHVVERDPNTIPIPDSFENLHVDDDELNVIDTQVLDSIVVEGDKRKEMLQILAKPDICSHGEAHLPAFRLGQKFKNKEDVKHLVKLHSIHTKRALYFGKNDKTRIRVKCKGVVADLTQSGPWKKAKLNCKKIVVPSTTSTCPWVLFISRKNVEDEWMVKTLVSDHTCAYSREIKACTAEFMGKNLIGQVERNPTIPVRALHEELQKKYEVGFSRMKAFRAKQIAQKHVFGDFQKQYALLWDYGLELKRTNVGTTFKIDVYSEPNVNSQTRMFKRVYVCLGPLKLGFKVGLRDFLGFDGCFLKGPYPGQILSAVGLDSNNGIYPLAYSIVESENTASWTWFLDCLAEDLDLNASSNFTFISDRQKGLTNAIAKIFPNAEHRSCLKHIHENMRRFWSDTEYKNLLWDSATTTTTPHFDNAMELFRQFDVEAYEWLKKIPPEQWSLSHFSGRAKTDSLTSNVCEVFNSKILDARDKPVITCLEYIREYPMKRIVVVQKAIDKCKGPLTPTATNLLEPIMKEATQNVCIFNGLDKTQVTTPRKDQYVVNLKEKTCTCRYWELTGIVCSHAVSAIWDKINRGGKKVPEIEAWVHPVYWLETWADMYSFKVDPINGRTMWSKAPCPTTLTAPKHQIQVGRPKK